MDFTELFALGYMLLVGLIILGGAIYIKSKNKKIKMFDDPSELRQKQVHSLPVGREFGGAKKLYERTFQDNARNPAAMSAIEDYDETRRLREGIGSSMSFGSLSDTTSIGSLGNDRLI